MSTVDDALTLFRGNMTVIGTEEGSCLHIKAVEWEDHLLSHFAGTRPPVGVYPMENIGGTDPLWVVYWGCVDFDEGEEDSWVHALNLRNVLRHFGIQAHMERTRSKGYHVWVFCSEWCHAAIMRRALLAAAQIVDAPTKEINPKQTELDEGQVGNYVRLPYPKGAPTDAGRRCMVDTSRNPIPFEEWVGSVVTTEPANLELVAHYYRNPHPPRPITRKHTSLDYQGELPRLAQVMLRDGPLHDRSGGLYKLACLVAEAGMDEDAAVELVVQADQRWADASGGMPKFVGRKDGEKQILHLVRKAFDA